MIPMKTLVSLLSGFLTWPVLEYILHRYMGHTWKLKTLFKLHHTRHHVETDYFAPTLYKVMAAIPACSILFVLTALLSGAWLAGLAFTAGFIVMYSVVIDKLAGTCLTVSVVKVPKNIALPWLFEPGQNNIHPQFAKDFQFK